MTNLAHYGDGQKLSDRWPTWPPQDDQAEENAIAVLRSGRWAISETSTGSKPWEQRFAEDFAAYHDVPYCVPCSSGTSAITIALEALGLTRGAEVLVPGITWVACASAVAGAGLVPVLVDIDPRTLCMSVDAAEAALTPSTEAILAVHYGCNTVDIDGFLSLCQRRGLALIEDCAQAHGAEYRNKKVGTFGDIGVFSMQASKVLTAGEGGAAITCDERLYELMAQYRADGRLYARNPSAGQPQLRQVGDVQGRNLCMSEIQAAILTARLPKLDAENQRRRATARLLDRMLDRMQSVATVPAERHMTKRTYYRYCIRLAKPPLCGIEDFAAALGRELGINCEVLHQPLNACRLYNPLGSPQKYDPEILARLNPTQYSLPNAEKAWTEIVTIPQYLLLTSDYAALETVPLSIDQALYASQTVDSQAAR